ncbi:MAG: hypothetical protein E3J64_08570 [Anaerolineales bacterium]|nr:MAG: hypothetical protein E3J64_08570 [Anaerolineales bacterium]
MLEEVVLRIDEFKAECDQAGRTDARDAWALLWYARVMAREGAVIQEELLSAVKRLLRQKGGRLSGPEKREFVADVKEIKKELRRLRSGATGLDDAVTDVLAFKAAEALGVASCVHRASGEYDRTVNAVAGVLREGV